MDQLQLLQNLIQNIRIKGRLDKDDSDLLLNAIEKAPFELWHNMDACATVGNFLLAFLDEEIQYEKKLKFSHFAFLYYERSRRLLDDKSNFSDLMQYMFHRVENSQKFLEIYYQKISLINNFGSSFKDTIDYIIKNDIRSKFSDKVKTIDYDRVIGTLLFYYIEQYNFSLTDFKQTRQPIPPITAYLNQLSKELQGKEFSQEEKLLGNKLDIVLFDNIKEMAEKKDFDLTHLRKI